MEGTEFAYGFIQRGSLSSSSDLTEDAKRAMMIAAPVSGFDEVEIGSAVEQGHAITRQIRPAAEASPRSFPTPKQWSGRIVAR